MSPSGIANSLFGQFQSLQSNALWRSTQNTGSFASSLALRKASQQAPSVDALLTLVQGNNAGSSFLAEAPSTSPGLAANDLARSLFNPGAAFRMMSVINTSEVAYKAQFAELSEMKGAVAGMQSAGESLAALTPAMDDAAIQSALQVFTSQYNAWIDRFGNSVKQGGVLAGTQAAEVSLYELEQSIGNIFNGATSGFHGVRDVGLSIDQGSDLAIFDPARLASALASNREGVIATLNEFGSNFARSAELLNSANNFIPNRLANLDRVIDYLDENLPALQSEFGLGTPARPSAQTARALAAYQCMQHL